MRTPLRDLLLLLKDPGEWSARRYHRKNSMELAALHPRMWRAPQRDIPGPDEDVPQDPGPPGRDPR